jgi:hypothetical protein
MRCGLILAGVLGLVVLAPAAHRRDEPEVPKEVRDMVGTYTGEWTLYGIDETGAVVKKIAWTDTVKAAKPQVKDDRAFITATDEMTFEGGKGSFKMEIAEGFYLKKGGGVGDAFVEQNGQLHKMSKLADNVWSYSNAASAQEQGQLGFPKDATGQHVVVKVVTKEQGAETHRISRLTTVTWKDKDGKERTLQFVSLQGYHKRQP